MFEALAEARGYRYLHEGLDAFAEKGGLPHDHVDVFPDDGDEVKIHDLGNDNHWFLALASTDRMVRLINRRDFSEEAKKECYLVPSIFILSIG